MNRSNHNSASLNPLVQFSAKRPTLRTANRQQRGASLVELCMVLVVMALLLGSALPGFQTARLARHLDGAAAQLETDIQYTRNLAVAERRNLRMSFFQDNNGACYVVHSGDANACTCNAQGVAVCGANAEAARSVRYSAAHPVKLQSNVKSIVFGPNLGTSTPTGTVKFQTSPTHAVNAVVNVMGRVRHCAPATATAVRGYAKC